MANGDGGRKRDGSERLAGRGGGVDFVGNLFYCSSASHNSPPTDKGQNWAMTWVKMDDRRGERKEEEGQTNQNQQPKISSSSSTSSCKTSRLLVTTTAE
jgi:hypothetical protein